MYMLVYSLKTAGYTEALVLFFGIMLQQGELLAIMDIGFAYAPLSAIMNNLPTAMMVNLSIRDAGLNPHISQFLALANVVGTPHRTKVHAHRLSIRQHFPNFMCWKIVV